MSEPDGRWAQYMDDLRIGANVHTPLEVRGTLTRLAGLVLEAVGLRVPVGSQCLIANGKREPVLADDASGDWNGPVPSFLNFSAL